MKITGELLKSERTRKNLSVQDVAFSLKLSNKIINAIEAGDTENLPAKTFIRGFVKSYAQYLKIDVDQVMRQFQEEMGSTQPMPKAAAINTAASESTVVRTNTESDPRKAASAPPSEQTRVLNESKSGHSLIYIGTAVVIVILIVAVNRISDRYQKESIVNPQDISKVQPLDPNQPQTAVTNSTSTPETQAAVASSETSAAASTPASADTNTASSTPIQAPQSATPTSTPAVAANTASTGEVDEGFEPSSGKPVELILEAKKDTEVLYARGNTKTFSKIKLSAKQVQVIRSTSGLHLKSEDGGAIRLTVNGIDKGNAGPNNKAIRLTF